MRRYKAYPQPSKRLPIWRLPISFTLNRPRTQRLQESPSPWLYQPRFAVFTQLTGLICIPGFLKTQSFPSVFRFSVRRRGRLVGCFVPLVSISGLSIIELGFRWKGCNSHAKITVSSFQQRKYLGLSLQETGRCVVGASKYMPSRMSPRGRGAGSETQSTRR